MLTPVLCASLLKPVEKGHEAAESGVRFLRPFFIWFDRGFYFVRDRYVSMVGRSLAGKTKYVLLYLVIVVALGFLFRQMPTSYLPDEDQGIIFNQIMLPPNATLEQTKAVMDQVENYFLEDEKDAVDAVFTVAGTSFGGAGQNNGLAFVKLKDWEERKGADLKVTPIIQRAMGHFSKIRTAMIFPFAPPSVMELGSSKGFELQLLDRGGLGHGKLMEARNQLLGMAAQSKVVTKVRPNGQEDVPEYRIDTDWDKAGALGVPISSIHATIAAAFGSAYVNDFIQGGRVKRVYVQADAPYRMLPTRPG